jgi:hypothetical protein
MAQKLKIASVYNPLSALLAAEPFQPEKKKEDFLMASLTATYQETKVLREAIPSERDSHSYGPDFGQVGFDRRQFSYTVHIPERRSGMDRRTGFDRRCGKDRRVYDDPRGAAARKDASPGGDPRRRRERRSGLDRRRGVERRAGFRALN